jgi:hypothetical protein
MSLTHNDQKRYQQAAWAYGARGNSVRSVPPLQVKSPGLLDRSVCIRAPRKFHRTILDFNALGFWTGNVPQRGRAKAVQEFLISLQDVRTTGWQPIDDPLFWCLGARRALWTSTLSRVGLQPPEECPGGRTIPRWVAPSEMEYRTMAAWAYRHSTPQPEIHEICMQIRNQVRTGGGSRSCHFPTQATRTWLLWFSQAHQRHFEVPSETLATISAHRDRWENLSIRPHDAEAISVTAEAVRTALRGRLQRGKI